MGLDVTVYVNLTMTTKKVAKAIENEEDDENDELVWIGPGKRFGPSFEHPLKPGPYLANSKDSPRIGAYSYFYRFREALKSVVWSYLKVDVSLHSTEPDKSSSVFKEMYSLLEPYCPETPLLFELLQCSDCDCVLGPSACKKIFKEMSMLEDYVAHKLTTITNEHESIMKTYDVLQQCFRQASESEPEDDSCGGCVVFH